MQEILEALENYLRYLRTLGVKTVPARKKIKEFLSLECSPMPRCLEDLQRELEGCKRCKLARERTHLVFGEGNPRACFMLIGEAPGREEDQVGRPFVGRAGKLLDQMLAAIKLSRAELYITNVVKCRPPGNRTPEPDEIEACLPFLAQQIKLIRPRLICTLGLTAAQAVLSTSASLASLRGEVHQLEETKVVVTFHPAYLLRFPAYKREAWEDLKFLRRVYNELCTG